MIMIYDRLVTSAKDPEAPEHGGGIASPHWWLLKASPDASTAWKPWEVR